MRLRKHQEGVEKVIVNRGRGYNKKIDLMKQDDCAASDGQC